VELGRDAQEGPVGDTGFYSRKANFLGSTLTALRTARIGLSDHDVGPPPQEAFIIGTPSSAVTGVLIRLSRIPPDKICWDKHFADAGRKGSGQLAWHAVQKDLTKWYDVCVSKAEGSKKTGERIATRSTLARSCEVRNVGSALEGRADVPEQTW